jgi:hypothetical protein
VAKLGAKGKIVVDRLHMLTLDFASTDQEFTLHTFDSGTVQGIADRPPVESLDCPPTPMRAMPRRATW